MIRKWIAVVVFVIAGAASADAGGIGQAIARGTARGLAKSAARAAAKSTGRAAEKQAIGRALQIQRKDIWNHAHTPVRPLRAPRTVYRYTSPSRAREELRSGVAPGRHMTATAPAGHPPSPETAQRRYGLAEPPEVRETITLPKGFPARHNKVPGGRPGTGEITSSKGVPPSAIKKVTPLRQQTNR
jgi:hypothetical protein